MLSTLILRRRVPQHLSVVKGMQEAYSVWQEWATPSLQKSLFCQAKKTKNLVNSTGPSWSLHTRRKSSAIKKACSYHGFTPGNRRKNSEIILFPTEKVSDWVSEITQSCPTLCDPTKCSLPGFSVHEILWARVLEWVASSFSNWKRKRQIKKKSLKSKKWEGEKTAKIKKENEEEKLEGNSNI